MLQLCPRLGAAHAVGSHIVLKPGGELRSATSTLGALYSIGEPTHTTEEIHASGRRVATLWEDGL